MSSIQFMVLVATGITEVICATTLIRQLACNSAPILLNLFYFGFVLNAVVVAFVVYGFAGDFYVASHLALSKFKRQVRNQNAGSLPKHKRNFRSRFLVSCQVEKVRFGLSNFIDKTTPAVFQLFCVNRVIDMLLVK